MKQAFAQLNYLRIAPRKVRRVADLIRNKDVVSAQIQLQFLRLRPAPELLKLLKSAINNAEHIKLDQDRLFIKKITVDGGPVLKRGLHRARGVMTPILKRSSHVTLILEESKRLLTKKHPKVKKVTRQSTEKVINEDLMHSHEHTLAEPAANAEKAKSTTKRFREERKDMSKTKSFPSKTIGTIRRFFRRKSI